MGGRIMHTTVASIKIWPDLGTCWGRRLGPHVLPRWWSVILLFLSPRHRQWHLSVESLLMAVPHHAVRTTRIVSGGTGSWVHEETHQRQFQFPITIYERPQSLKSTFSSARKAFLSITWKLFGYFWSHHREPSVCVPLQPSLWYIDLGSSSGTRITLPAHMCVFLRGSDQIN